MKTLKTILVTTIILSITSSAMTAKVAEKNEKKYTVIEGDSKNIQGKRGLAVDLRYKSQEVAVGEVSTVNITIVSPLNKGSLTVDIGTLDDTLIGLDNTSLKFELSSKEKNEFPINLEVSSATEGIHYINLTLTVEGQGSRVLAVPVNVGDITEKITKKSVETTKEGLTISVSSAEEEIK